MLSRSEVEFFSSEGPDPRFYYSGFRLLVVCLGFEVFL